jgi:hypothetical protein
MQGEARARVPVRASSSILSEFLPPHVISLVGMTILHKKTRVGASKSGKLGEARARAPVRASYSILSQCLAPYGTSLADMTILL